MCWSLINEYECCDFDEVVIIISFMWCHWYNNNTITIGEWKKAIVMYLLLSREDNEINWKNIQI